MFRRISFRVIYQCPASSIQARSTWSLVCLLNQQNRLHRNQPSSFVAQTSPCAVWSSQKRGFITKWDRPMYKSKKSKDVKKDEELEEEVEVFALDEDPKKKDDDDEEIEEINLKGDEKEEIGPMRPLRGRLATITSKDDRPKSSQEYWKVSESLKKAKLQFFPPPDDAHIEYVGYLLEEKEKRKYETLMARDRARTVPNLDVIVDHSETGSALFDFMNTLGGKMGIPADWRVAMSKNYDLSPAGYRRYKERVQWGKDILAQSFDPNTHAILGPDLASAAFTVNRGGRVKFVNKATWFTREEWDNLPDYYDPEYRLQAIDAEGLGLMYEGFDNYILLDDLEEFNLSNNPRLDDFTCDRIARQYRNSTKLTSLILRNNILITYRGIEALVKIKSLRYLDITGTLADQYQWIELLELLFADVIPNCRIIRSDRDPKKMIEGGEKDEPEKIEDGQPKDIKQLSSS